MVVRNFQKALAAELAQRRILTAFSRLHPLIAQHGVLDGIGECRAHGHTVSIDLTLPVAEQWAQYRATCRTRINRLRREGVICLRDEDQRHLAEFVNIYHETMRRVNAHGSYFFDDAYFAALAGGLGPKLQLFVATVGATVVAGGLVTICDGIVQYHLGGTRGEFLSLSPTGLIFDTVRLWARENGARVCHLGGGVGSREDSLFHFKTGFSGRRHGFGTWRWLIVPEIYREICDERVRLARIEGLAPVSADYFPAYRCPTARVQLASQEMADASAQG